MIPTLSLFACHPRDRPRVPDPGPEDLPGAGSRGLPSGGAGSHPGTSSHLCAAFLAGPGLIRRRLFRSGIREHPHPVPAPLAGAEPQEDSPSVAAHLIPLHRQPNLVAPTPLTSTTRRSGACFLSRAASLNLPRCVHSAVGTARSLIRHLENAENLGFERGSDRAHSGPLAPYGTSDPLPRHRMCVRAGERRNVGCQARRGSRSEGNSPMGREGFPSQIAGFSLYEHRNALPILKLPT